MNPNIEWPATLRAAHESARAVLERRARLDRQTNQLPGAIEDSEKALSELRATLERAEAAAAIATPEEEKQLRRRADDLRAKVDGISNELTSLKQRLVGLESAAPTIDAAILDAYRKFEAELRPFLRKFTRLYAKELFDALEPARVTVAKLHALNQFDECSSFFAGMFVPDPIAYQHVSGQNFARHGNRNLLDVASDKDMVACLAPLLDTRNRLRTSRPYLPQHRRPRNTPPTDHGIRIPA